MEVADEVVGWRESGSKVKVKWEVCIRNDIVYFAKHVPNAFHCTLGESRFLLHPQKGKVKSKDDKHNVLGCSQFLTPLGNQPSHKQSPY